MTKQLPLSMFLRKDKSIPNTTLDEALNGDDLEELTNAQLVFLRDNVKLNDPDQQLVNEELDLRLSSHKGDDKGKG